MKRQILACVDNSANSIGVCDAAIHFAKLLEADITLFHALEPISDTIPDLSGNLHFDAQHELLEALLSEEEKKAKIALKSGEELLQGYKKYCNDQGITTSTLHLHGDLTEIINSLENEYKLLIVGKIGEDEEGSHIKELIKEINLPIMLSNKEFKEIKKVLFAYDGSPSLNKALDRCLQEPLFINAQRHLLHLSKNENSSEILENGKKLFDKYNKEVTLHTIKETSADDLLKYAYDNEFDVIGMGAYSSSTFVHLFFGSFTNEIIKKSKLPLFIFK